jgi:hypothetical protein
LLCMHGVVLSHISVYRSAGIASLVKRSMGRLCRFSLGYVWHASGKSSKVGLTVRDAGSG